MIFVLQQQQNLGRRFGSSKMHLSSPPVALAAVRSKEVRLLLIVTPIVGFCNCCMFCCALLCVHSSFTIILMGKRKLVALLCLSSWCLVIVVWFFPTMPRVCLQFLIVVYSDHTHLLFLAPYRQRITKSLIRLSRCAGWSAPLPFSWNKGSFFSWYGKYMLMLLVYS